MITIIVLLILASVSIAMLTGENGILTQAQKAKNETEEAQKKEDTIINQYESYINQATNTEAVVGEIVTGGNKLYTNNGTAIIPEGFMIVPGLDNVEEGLVISDNSADTEVDSSSIVAEGNQFVWVPVPDFDKFKRYDFAGQEYKDDMFVTNNLTENKFYEPSANGTANSTEVEKMYKSVKDNKGFYVGRYESGIGENDITISKKNVEVYNRIICGNSEGDSDGAVQLARAFAQMNEHSNVTSTLIYGVQWDAIMRWLSEGTEEEKTWLIDSTGKGNYLDSDDTNNPSKTGVNENYKIKNIYDLAGNVFEWTMETYSLNIPVRRGGDYGSEGNGAPCSKRTITGNSTYVYSNTRISYILIFIITIL